MTAAGDLRERLAFDKRSEISDGYGSDRGAWVEQFQCYGQVKALKLSTDTVIASRLSGRTVLTVIIRYSNHSKLIVSDWRIRNLRSPAGQHDLDAASPGEVYAIHTMLPDARHQWITITCESGVPAG